MVKLKTIYDLQKSKEIRVFLNVLAENRQNDSKNGMTRRQKQMNEIIWLALIIWQVSHYSHLIEVKRS